MSSHACVNAVNYYALLGVRPDASVPEIKAAYKACALQYHPDKNKSPEATDIFQRIANAMDLLSDKDRRDHYNHELARPTRETQAHDQLVRPAMDTFEQVFGTRKANQVDLDGSVHGIGGWMDRGRGWMRNWFQRPGASVPVMEQHVDPDLPKRQDVLRMQQRTGKEWPALLKRFTTGCENMGGTEAMDLVLETVDFLVEPVRHMNRRVMRDQVDGSGYPTGLLVFDSLKPVILLMGITGSGKSVTANWFAECAIIKNEDNEDAENEGTSLIVCDAKFPVGHESANSMTFAPIVCEFPEFFLIDCPGFADTNGIEIRIGMDIAYREILKLAHPAHVLALMPIDSFLVGKGTASKQELSKIQRLMPTLNCDVGKGLKAEDGTECIWKIGITKCDKDFTFKSKTKFREAVDLIKREGIDEKHVVNMNECIFSGDGAKARDTLLKSLLHDTRMPESLASDCLNSNDTEAFGEIVSAVLDADVQWNESQAQESQLHQGGDIGLDTIEKVEAQITLQVDVLGDFAAAIYEGSTELRESGRLSLERHDPKIAKLCSFGQCRLKSCFLQAEEMITMVNLGKTIEMCDTLMESAKPACGHFLTEEHVAELQAKCAECQIKMDKNADRLGFSSRGAILAAWKSRGGFGAAGFGAAVAGVSVLGSGAWAGTATITYLAIGGAATGALLVLVGLGGAIIWGSLQCMEVEKIEKSKQLKDLFIRGFENVGKANDAVTAHQTTMTRVKQDLIAMQVRARD